MLLKAPPRTYDVRPILGMVGGFVNRLRSLGRFAILRWTIRYAARAVVAILVLAGIHHLFFVTSTPGHQYMARGKRIVASALPTIKNSVTGMFARPKSINIRIKFLDYQRLGFERQLAFERGLIVQHADSYVPAKIEFDDRTVAVKMRLKGDVTNHLEGDKWSFRIRVKGGETIFGMRTFSIQDPVRSAFIYEWILHEAFRREGLLAPRYEFIDVSINGRSVGILALEESFGKEMLESQNRREGPIIRFSEDLLWASTANAGTYQAETFYASEVDAFGSMKTHDDPVLRDQFSIASALLRGFRDQQLTVAEAFDIEKTATCFALIDLLSGLHANRWKNIRFYYNPISSVLEPIPYNAYGAQSAFSTCISSEWPLTGQLEYGPHHVRGWLDAFMMDRDFYAMYVRELARVSEPRYINKLLGDIGPIRKQQLRIIHRDDPDFIYSNQYILRNAEKIRRAVHMVLPTRASLDVGDPDGGVSALRVANSSALMIELLAIVDMNNGTSYEFEPRAIVAPRKTDVPQDVLVPLPSSARGKTDGFEEGTFALEFAVLGMQATHRVPLTHHHAVREKNLKWRLAESAQDLHQLDGFHVDEQNATIVIAPGTWTIRESVYIPAGYVLRVSPGATMLLSHGASVISYASLLCEGTFDHPIVFRSEDGSGGLIVLEAQEESVLEHVHFENLASPREGLWTTTGAVTFYESPLRISDCRFVNIHGEDMLNIVRSEFAVIDSSFSTSFSDGIDIDFGQGVVSGCIFDSIGNDAVDLSGSTVTVRACQVMDAGDKAISAGEGSRVEVIELDVINCRRGVVSKDHSEVVAREVSIQGAEVGFAAYQKKPEYGPASMTLTGITVESTPLRFLIEKGSWIGLDGQRFSGRKLEVARVLDGEER